MCILFIVIDWIDSVWKNTQVRLLEKKLKDLWKKVLILDYPRYEKTSSFAVKKYLSWKYGNNISAKQASIFYAIDRFDDLYNLNIKYYDYIIANRYTSSNMIHQWWKIKDKDKRNIFYKWLEDLEYNIFWLPKPDKIIYLNMTLDNSLKLLKKRWNKKDIHEKDIKHLKNAYKIWLDLVKRNGWIKIECEEKNKLRNIEDINKEIFEKLIKNYVI